MVAKSPEFEQAVKDSRSLSKTPSNDELLEVRLMESLFSIMGQSIADRGVYRVDLRSFQAGHPRSQVRRRP